MITNEQAEQLKKLKELLDVGVLTQEEFNAKKYQILGELPKVPPAIDDHDDSPGDFSTPNSQHSIEKGEVSFQPKPEDKAYNTETPKPDNNNFANASPQSVSPSPLPDQKISTPIYKKKWFIAIIAIIVVLGLAIAFSGGDDSDKGAQPANSESSVEEETSETETEEEPVLSSIEATYSGSTEAGTMLNDKNSGINVTGYYSDGSSSTIDTWSVKESKELKTEKETTVTIEYEGMTCDLTVKCTTIDPKKFKEKCKTIEYEKLARNPDEYNGEPLKIHGTVIQVIEGTDGNINLRVATSGYYDDVVLVDYTYKEKESHILEDDVVTLWGTYGGTYTYESTGGADITVPFLYAEYVTIE